MAEAAAELSTGLFAPEMAMSPCSLGATGMAGTDSAKHLLVRASQFYRLGWPCQAKSGLTAALRHLAATSSWTWRDRAMGCHSGQFGPSLVAEVRSIAAGHAPPWVRLGLHYEPERRDFDKPPRCGRGQGVVVQLGDSRKFVSRDIKRDPKSDLALVQQAPRQTPDCRAVV
jgi:hypothetical protein